MRLPVSALAAALLIASPGAAADEAAAMAERARQIIRDYSGRLESALQGAMAKGGPAEAVRVCRTEAPEIAAALSQDGWIVRRTSLRVRNPANAPDAFERRVLDEFEQRLAQGAAVSQLGYYQMQAAGEQYRFRYLKAIETKELCLACHGSAIPPEVAQVLAEHYPSDQARGFRAGDIRGAFTLTRYFSRPMAEY